MTANIEIKIFNLLNCFTVFPHYYMATDIKIVFDFICYQNLHGKILFFSKTSLRYSIGREMK